MEDVLARQLPDIALSVLKVIKTDGAGRLVEV